MITQDPGVGRRGLQRALVFGDLHFRQKWRAVWRRLSRLPHRNLTLLDAGCGAGRWSLEIGLRRPNWMITGIDRNDALIDSAKLRQQAWGVRNVVFAAQDFSAFSPDRPFDIVLAVCSTHYGTTPGEDERLFARMRDWLDPGGRIVLLLPRCREETSLMARLDRPIWHDRFSAADLNRLCKASDLAIDSLDSCIGRIGALAKQLDWSCDHLVEPVNSAVRLLAQGLEAVDGRLPGPHSRSLMWLLVGHRQQ